MNSRLWTIGAGAALLIPMLGGAFAAEPMEDRQLAVLQGLDKVTARVVELDIPVGITQQWGTLRITPRACRKAPPIEAPEAAAFLDIQEVQPDEQPTALFSGWMFASSPALSALEHPVYDVWVIDCK